MVKLIDIFDEKANILELFSNGEIEEMEEEEAKEFEQQVTKYLDELAEQEASKVDAIGTTNDKIKNQIDFLKDQEDKIRAKRKSLEKANERFRQYLYKAFQKHGIKKVKGTTRTIFLRQTESVQVSENPQNLPEQYRETRIEYKPLKKEIKEAIKNGEEVSGAELQKSETVQIK